MTAIPEKVRRLFEKQSLVAFGTASRNCEPNVVPIFWKIIMGEETILLIDNFMKKSKLNVLDNEKVCVSFWDSETEEAYKILGTGKYHAGGPVFKDGERFIQAKKPGRKIKGVIEIRVTEIYEITPGENAGNRIL